ncbi:MAG: DNA replication/repair protein RecF [Bartonella sp.]|nr:DNA replication/repair protein RecF [Bartonella sp.]
MSDGYAAKVVVQQLKLSNYRNYRTFSVNFSGKHVVFTGHNGAGKTNLLEAISLLSPGRGLRRSTYGDLICANADNNSFVVFAKLYSALFDEVDIGTTCDNADGGRKVRINGTSTSADRLTDYCRISWLIPAMDGLFTGSASDRRRFLDRMVLSIDPSHGRRVLDFEKVMRSRNRLLLDGNTNNGWFDALETQMAELATAIAAARIDVIRLLDGGKESDSHDVFPHPILVIEGLLEQALINQSAIDVEEYYRQKLHDGRPLDRAAGRTLEGPHRSDMKVFYAQKNMPAALCSTGEQKSLLMGLILAHAKITAQISGMAPILLLDEMAAHLDEQRRVALFNILDELGGQSFMTGTDRQLFSALDDRAEFFEISDGALRPL